MRTGVHTSVRGGFTGALKEAVDLGCTTFQMFTQSPRGWKTRVYTDHEFQEFRSERTKSGVDPVVVHAPYLPNLCTSSAELYKKSVDTLMADLDRCEKLEADYLVIHPGAYSPEADEQTGLKQILAGLNKAIAAVPGKSMILIENMAGGGRRLGGKFEEIKSMLDGVENPSRVGVCFDTCHAFAAGYDISTESGVKKTLSQFDSLIGLDRIRVFHVNDSKGELSSHRDRHEHLGKGHVGLPGLKALFSNEKFRNCAFILETPKDSPKADPENLKKLKGCLPHEQLARK